MYSIKEDLDLDTIMELKPNSIGNFCDEIFDSETLHYEVDEGIGQFVSRKYLCEYLGIGESTLTGWLKENRIPRMAKEAYVLAQVVTILQNEIKTLKNGVKIIKVNDTYQLCYFKEDEEGTLIGHVLVDGIQNIKIARLLAFSFPAFELLSEANNVIDEMLERTENNAYIEQLYELQTKISKEKLYANKYDTWKDLYGKKSSLINNVKIDLDDLTFTSDETKIKIPKCGHGTYTLTLFGKEYGEKSLANVLIRTLKELYKRDPLLLENLSNERERGRKAVIVAKKDNLKELNPESKSGKAIAVFEIADGWHISKCFGPEQLGGRLKRISKIARLEYGKDISFSENGELDLYDLEL